MALMTWGSDVSASSHRSGRTAPSRSARSRTCWALSSAVTYSALPGHWASSWSSRVLLPTPGSPPSNVTEPGTMPPPSTRSSSSMPLGCGRLMCGSTSPIGWAAAPEASTSGASRDTTSSTRVFHPPQLEHCPAHLGNDVPHSVQTCSTFSFAMPSSMTGGCGSGEAGDDEAGERVNDQRGDIVSEVRLGIDVACRADHQASLADERGEFVWSGWRFRTTSADLERLWAKIPDGVEVVVVMEPTRNAWVPLAAWLQAAGREVTVVPPEQSADLRDYYNKHTKTDRLDSKMLARLPLLHPEGLAQHRRPRPGRIRCGGRSGTARSLVRASHVGSAAPRRAGRVARPGLCRHARRRGLQQDRARRPRALRRPACLAQAGPQAAHGAADPCQPRASREAKADELLAAADEALAAVGRAVGSTSPSSPRTSPSKSAIIAALDAEIAAIDDRIEALYDDADPARHRRLRARHRRHPRRRDPRTNSATSTASTTSPACARSPASSPRSTSRPPRR